MATISQPFANSDQENQANNTSGGANNNGNGNQQQQPTQISGAGGSAGAGGTKPGGLNPNGGTSNNSTATSSGAFPNLQKYITANSGFNQQGGGLAGEVVGNLNAQGQQVQSNTQQATNAFGNQVNSANQSINNAFQNAQADLTNPYAAVSGQNTGTNAFGNPTSSGAQQDKVITGGALTAGTNSPPPPNAPSSPSNSTQPATTTAPTQPNPNVVSSFQQALGGQYTGPSSLNNLTGNQNYSALQQQAGNYTNQAQQAQTENGRFNLLSNMFGKQGYNTGQQTLDNSIMQSSPGQMQQLTGALGQANTVNQGLTNAYNQSVAQGAGAQANAANVGQQTRAALNNAIGAQYGNAQSELANAKTASQAQYDAALSGLNKGSINQTQANELGLNSLQGQSLYGANVANYLGQAGGVTGTGGLNLNNAITQNDYNQFQALQKLTGNQTGALTGNNNQVLSQFATGTQPGQLYNSSNYINANVNGGLLGGVAAQQNAYNGAANPFVSTINSLGSGNLITDVNGNGGQAYGGLGGTNGGSVNAALGIGNPLTQNLNALMGQANPLTLSNSKSAVPGETEQQWLTNSLGLKNFNGTQLNGNTQTYLGAIQNLLNAQNQYNTGQQFQITPNTPTQ